MQNVPSTLAGRRKQIMDQLQRELHAPSAAKAPREQVISEVTARTKEIVNELAALTPEEKEALVASVIDEMFAFGLLSALLRDASVNEIWIQSHKSIAVSRNGKVEMTGLAFDSEGHLHRMIDKIIWQEEPRRVHLLVRSTNALSE
jgi:pilus assembly protein CpaF